MSLDKSFLDNDIFDQKPSGLKSKEDEVVKPRYEGGVIRRDPTIPENKKYGYNVRGPRVHQSRTTVSTSIELRYAVALEEYALERGEKKARIYEEMFKLYFETKGIQTDDESFKIDPKGGR